MAAEPIKARELYVAGEEQQGTVDAETVEPGIVGLHVDNGDFTTPATAYLTPPQAARLGERLIRAADDAMPEVKPSV